MRPRYGAAIVVLLIVALVLWRQQHVEPVNGRSSVASTPNQSAGPVVPRNAELPASVSTPPRSGPKELPLSQQFASATDLKEFYDQLSMRADETGGTRYYMGKVLATCGLFINKTITDYEKGYERLPQADSPLNRRKLDALRQLGRQCDGFSGFRGAKPLQLYLEAGAKGYPAAVAVTLGQLDHSGLSREAEVTAAKLLERPDGEVIERLLPYLQLRSTPWAPDLRGETPPKDVLQDAWRLYACEQGADCGPTSQFVFERCWGYGECDVTSFESYLREYKPATYQAVRRFEEEISRSVTARDWRALGIITSGSPRSEPRQSLRPSLI